MTIRHRVPSTTTCGSRAASPTWRTPGAPPGRPAAGRRGPQHRPFGLLAGRGPTMTTHPRPPVRDHSGRRLQPRQPLTRAWRTRRPCTSTATPALRGAAAGGTSGMAARRRGHRRRAHERLTSWRGAGSWRSTLPRRHGPHLLPPCEASRSRATLGTSRSASTPSSASSATRRSRSAGPRRSRRAQRQPRARRRLGPGRPRRGVPPGAPRPRGRGGSQPGGMMRYGIPDLPAPPRRPRRRDRPDPRALGVELRLEHRPTSRPSSRTVRRGVPRRRCAARQARVPPAGSAARVVDAVEMLHGVGRASSRCSGAGSPSTAATRRWTPRTARRLGAEDAIVVYRRTRDRMPAHPSEVGRGRAEGVQFAWLSTIKQVGRGGADDRGGWSSTRRASTADRRGGAPDADSVVLALGQETDLQGSSAGAGPRAPKRRGPGRRRRPDDRAPGLFASGDMVPAVRSATVGIGHGRRAAVDRRVAAQLLPDAAPDRPGDVRPAAHLVLHDASRAHCPSLEAGPALVDVRRGGPGLRPRHQCPLRGPPLPVVRDVFSCDNCFGM